MTPKSNTAKNLFSDRRKVSNELNNNIPKNLYKKSFTFVEDKEDVRLSAKDIIKYDCDTKHIEIKNNKKSLFKGIVSNSSSQSKENSSDNLKKIEINDKIEFVPIADNKSEYFNNESSNNTNSECDVINTSRSNDDLNKGVTSILPKKKDKESEGEDKEKEINYKNVTNTEEILDFYDYTKECFNKISNIKFPPDEIPSKFLIDYKLNKTKCIIVYDKF